MYITFDETDIVISISSLLQKYTVIDKTHKFIILYDCLLSSLFPLSYKNTL